MTLSQGRGILLPVMRRVFAEVKACLSHNSPPITQEKPSIAKSKAFLMKRYFSDSSEAAIFNYRKQGELVTNFFKFFCDP